MFLPLIGNSQVTRLSPRNILKEWNMNEYNSCNSHTITNLEVSQSQSYPIIRTSKIFSSSNSLLADVIGDRNFLVFISPSIDRLYRRDISNYIKHFFAIKINKPFVIPTGEKNKNIETVLKVCSLARAAGVERKTIFIGIGGGILTDIVAFAASMFRRGTDCIRIGTTLIGQVDASIGIKCGVNLGKSKNLLGAFHPSYKVIIDHHFLTTLPIRHIRCGLAEIIKLAIVRDNTLFKLVEENYQGFVENRVGTNASIVIVDRSITRMVSELATNPTEKNLKRVVDFGHTFSPHIEAASNFQISHGEAVGMDLALTCVIANKLGYLSSNSLHRILHLLKKVGLPLLDEIINPTELYSSLHHIQLHRGNMLNLPIPTSIGTCEFIDDLKQLPFSIVDDALCFLDKHSKRIRNE